VRRERPRVLVLAESANPDWASVPLEGWSLSAALRNVADVELATHVRNRSAIENTGLGDVLHAHYIDNEWLARPLHGAVEALRKATGIGWSLTTTAIGITYYEFERKVWAALGERIRNHDFDIVHRVNPLSPTIPSLLARRCEQADVPFVWGPINGGVPWPAEFRREQRREGEWLVHLRGAARLMPGTSSTRRSTAAFIVGSISAAEQLAAQARKSVYIPENGIDLERLTADDARQPGKPVRIAFVGRLVPYKGADILIEAVEPMITSGDVIVDVIGDGPEMARLQEMVSSRGLQHGVMLEGWVDHRDLAKRLSQASLFGFPSIREFGGAVVVEAMSLGLVPIVADYAGPAEHVTASSGVRVPMGTRDELVVGFRDAIRSLVDAPDRVAAMSEAATRRARTQYTWERKAEQIAEVYAWVRGLAPKPDFGCPISEDL
jgi:glycosyltransferase involved in cell wall biosynthesis